MKTITKIIYPAFALFAFACFALLPMAQAVVPAPDGGYPNFNTAEGEDALFSLTTGVNNTALGFQALYNNTTGNYNNGTGAFVLFSNTTGFSNTAMGNIALYSNTTGVENTAFGVNCLFSNTTGNNNIAIGNSALYTNTTGVGNVATGQGALFSNTTADFNTASGAFALFSNTTGELNTASGVNVLYNNTTGHRNTATGLQALYFNTTGARNTATGTAALFNNTTGDHNAAYGWASLFFNTTGNLNIVVGDAAGQDLSPTGNNNIAIGSPGVFADANKIRIGALVPFTDGTGLVHPAHTATYIAGIMGKTSPKGTPVFINANGQLGTATSSARFKDAIKPMDKASEAIHALKPVTFRYKKEIDPDGTSQFGLVAEDVAAVNPDLVVRDGDGKVYTVRYEAVNAMLLNEFLKEHRKVEQLKEDFESKVAEQQKQIEMLTAGLQKVSAQIEVTKPAPQTVAYNQ